MVIQIDMAAQTYSIVIAKFQIGFEFGGGVE